MYECILFVKHWKRKHSTPAPKKGFLKVSHANCLQQDEGQIQDKLNGTEMLKLEVKVIVRVEFNSPINSPRYG